METRELDSGYLHIIRDRFEQHRRHFDPDMKLGDRARPQAAGSLCPSVSSPSRPPSSLLKRVVEMQKGVCEAGGGWDDEEDDTDGIFRKRTYFENQAGWVAYVVGLV